MTSTLFWILVGVGAVVLVAVYWATHEQASVHKRRLRRIRKRLDEIERRKAGSNEPNRE